MVDGVKAIGLWAHASRPGLHAVQRHKGTSTWCKKGNRVSESRSNGLNRRAGRCLPRHSSALTVHRHPNTWTNPLPVSICKRLLSSPEVACMVNESVQTNVSVSKRIFETLSGERTRVYHKGAVGKPLHAVAHIPYLRRECPCCTLKTFKGLMNTFIFIIIAAIFICSIAGSN